MEDGGGGRKEKWQVRRSWTGKEQLDSHKKKQVRWRSSRVEFLGKERADNLGVFYFFLSRSRRAVAKPRRRLDLAVKDFKDLVALSSVRGARA
jgi:hypothetical protein